MQNTGKVQTHNFSKEEEDNVLLRGNKLKKALRQGSWRYRHRRKQRWQRVLNKIKPRMGKQCTRCPAGILCMTAGPENVVVLRCKHCNIRIAVYKNNVVEGVKKCPFPHPGAGNTVYADSYHRCRNPKNPQDRPNSVSHPQR